METNNNPVSFEESRGFLWQTRHDIIYADSYTIS
jgi:hypothetical protein